MYERILIFGGTGSGKTTLAKKISTVLKIPYYTTDDMVYKKIGKLKYTEQEIKKNMLKTSKKKKWIIEGVHSANWILPAVKKADFVIVLDIKKIVLYKRVIKRYLAKEKGHYENIRSLFKMLYWSHIYKQASYFEHSEFIKNYKKKHVVLRNNKDIVNLIKNLF